MGEFLTIEEFAAYFRVHIATARRWIWDGKVRIVKLPGGTYLVPREEVNRLSEAKALK